MTYLTVAAERQLQSPRQFLGEVDIEIIRPPEVPIAEVGIIVVLITYGVITDDGSSFKRFPLRILLESGSAITLDIVISQKTDIPFRCLDRGDAAITILIPGSQLECQALTYIHIDEVDTLGV